MRNSRNRILVLTTGGTIDKVYFDALSDFQVGHSVLEELLKEAHVTADYEIVEVMRKDSLDLSVADRQLIRDTIERHPQVQVIITHGTDTMTETARVLAALCKKFGDSTPTGGEARTIVLTGALSPARFARTDAAFNVGMAFAAVQSLPAGVYIVMNGQVFDALKVRKDRANNRFVASE